MNAHQAWQSTLGQLQMEMSKATFETWVQHAELVTHKDQVFTIGVKNAYARDWLDGRLTNTIQRILAGLMGESQKVEFIVWQKEYDNANNGNTHTGMQQSKQVKVEEPDLQPNETINRKYTFDNFVVGASNRLAHAASLAVADSPAKAYNPLFLYGGVGLGKTHLLQAIGNAAHQKGLRVLYVSSEEFTNDFIFAIQKHTNAAFREKYRQTDVLLIDDIQFIANKEQTQEEFFHTFNTLHGQDKQIVITSDRPPKALETLEERLRSRFEWGLIGDIQPPDLETRIAILKSKAERSGRQVPVEILEVIARQIQSNIRELEGALTRVVAFADFSGKELNFDLVNTALVDMLPKRTTVGPEQIVDAVSNFFGISRERLVGRSRTREVVLPRQVAMYLLRNEANVSLPQIGNTLGGRDHSTVMHACDKITDMIERDNRLRRQVIQIREDLYGSAQIAI